MSAASDSRRALVLAAALWPAFVGSAAGQPQWTDENLEQWVFNRGGGPAQNAASARKELDRSLLLNIQNIDRVCKLTEAQKKKMQLAGRGDIKRFYDHYEVVKQKFHRLKPKQQDDNNWQEHWNELWQDINPLQTKFQSGLFHEDSLLHKSLRHTLTAEQLPRYQAQAEERRRFHHRASIELAVNSFEQSMPLRDAQRQELIALLLKELKPSSKSNRIEVYIVTVRMSLLPEEKLKPVFDRTQWKMVRAQLANYKGQEQWLKQSGQWPEDDEDVDAPPADAKPAPKRANQP
jgi:hypothetical protein